MNSITIGLRPVVRIRHRQDDPREALVKRHRNRYRRCVTVVVWGALVTINLPATGAGGTGLFFAEPYTGKKVDTYSVELPIDRQARRTFAVPADCAEVARSVTANAAQWGTRTEQSVWWKVDNDCRYFAFLHRYTNEPVQDFVSGYDFMNAYLRDLPIRARCRRSAERAFDPACKPLPPGVPDLSRFLPFQDRGPEAPRLDVSPCRLEKGIFRGRVVNDRTGIHCEADPDAPGFRVISADYADVNGDRVLDVVLRLVPLAPGASRMPLILPLTRVSPDDAFTIPAEVRVP